MGVMDPERVNYHYCDDLPTSPLPGVKTVLVSGASGYVARRLVPELLFRGYRVRCMLRIKGMPQLLTHNKLEYVYADALNKEQLQQVMKGIDVAYYLIHSMRTMNKKFRQTDKIAAKNFREAAEDQGVKKIIYLGGLGETSKILSRHLESRIEVGSILSDGSIPVIRLRGAIIIGTGSASYELLKSMIQHMRWVPFLPEFNSRCQPIAVRDVIKYLVGVLETDELKTRIYPIGCRDVMTYQEMVKRFAKVMNKRIRFFDVSWVPLPVNVLCRLFAYWLHLFISVPVNITSLLLESLRTDVVCPDESIREILPFETMGFETAVKSALQKEKNSMVYSHWSDVPPENMIDLLPLYKFESSNFIVEEHSKDIPVSAETVFQSICRIGGSHGWVHANLLWKIRGFIDRVLGGVGLNRGRRDPNDLRIGDSVDFWRVENLTPNRELLLRAELISPGLSWLQFELEPIKNDSTRLTLRAHFIPDPIWGHVYWTVLSKFHTYIFKGMLNYFFKESVQSYNSDTLNVSPVSPKA
jgi:uncharacterized protein YbjT (DUF2867 family)